MKLKEIALAISFLDQQIIQIKEEIPIAYWPVLSDQRGFYETVTSTFDATSDKYMNRPMQCAFVRKILDSVQGSVLERFSEITNFGSICIQSDLKIEARNKFTADLIDFFWTEPWLSHHGKFYSLEEIVKRSVGPSYKRPEFHVAVNLEFDAFGGGFSELDLKLFESNPKLSEYAWRVKKIDPNVNDPFTLLGSAMAVLVREQSYSMLSTFQPGSKIYISNSWGPAEMVEILVHEYGHVFHGETNHNFSWNDKDNILSVYTNRVHEESMAESFAWMVLRDFYHDYPELKFFHIGKLRMFQKWRPTDPHLVGAAGVAKLFHSECSGSFSDLKEYAASLNLNEYLSSRGFEDELTSLGSIDPLHVEINFTP
jgi:hypothetical protein